MWRFDEFGGQGAFAACWRRYARAALLVSGLLAMLRGSAQGDRGSLTEQFPNMSAKERSRIAEREQSDAAKDQAYQQVMRQADEAFRSGRYEEALTYYEQARAARPYNVYPKVKIEDIRALLAKRQTAAEDAPVDTTAAVTTQPPAAALVPAPEVVHMVPPPPEVVEVAPVPEPDPAPARSTAQRSEPLAPAAGVIERRYKEGNAHVIERVVTVEGRTVIYKRVFHAWGQVFYFEDGKPVDERVWKARFPK